MNSDIEKLLLAKAIQDAEAAPKLENMVALGAGGGAGLGALLGSVPHSAGKAIGDMRGTNRPLKPGLRMAGGLVGMLVGGGLGAAYQQQAINDPSGAGALLAKIQSQGGVTPDDKARLEMILREAYSAQGLV